MSLARDLIDAALAADLTQNELRVFLALFRQTLCYGKTADPLNMKRLATLTAIRKDRLAPAIAGVTDKGLFTVQPHPVFERFQLYYTTDAADSRQVLQWKTLLVGYL